MLDDIDAAIDAGHRRILLCSDCGTGKGSIIAFLTIAAIEQDMRTLIMVPRDALLKQQMARSFAAGLDESQCTYLAGGRKFNPDAKVWIASQQTLARRTFWHDLPEDHRIDIALIDEAHDAAFSKPGIHLCKEADVDLVVGLTATPFCLSKDRNLNQLFDTVVSIRLDRQELIERGYLTPTRYHAMSKQEGRPVLDNCATRGGEWVASDLAVACDQPQLVSHLIDENVRITGGDKRTLAFAVNCAHAESIHKELLRRGMRSALVTSGTPTDERAVLYKQFEQGELLYLCSVDVISLGFDSVEAEVCLCARPTKSRAKFWQIVGRVGRPSPHTGKTCGYVLDQPGNALRLGVPELRGRYDFEPEKTKREGQDSIPLKECPECGLYQRNFNRVCEGCSYEFPTADKITEGSEMKELDLLGKLKTVADAKKAKLRSLLRKAMRAEFSPAWANVKYREAYGDWPSAEMRSRILYPEPSQADAVEFLGYLTRVAIKKGEDNIWVRREFVKEFGTSFLMDDVVTADPILSRSSVLRPSSSGVLAALRAG